MSTESDSAAWFRRDNALRDQIRVQREWMDQQVQVERDARAVERRTIPRVALTLDTLIDAIGKRVDDGAGWDRRKREEYADHLVQPWCGCGAEASDDWAPGWTLCQHARDEGF
jgi:hypothetical protein